MVKLYHFTELGFLRKILKDGKLHNNGKLYLSLTEEKYLSKKIREQRKFGTELSHIRFCDISIEIDSSKLVQENLHKINYNSPESYINQQSLVNYIINANTIIEEYTVSEIKSNFDKFKIEKESVYVDLDIPKEEFICINYYFKSDRIMYHNDVVELQEICKLHNLKLNILEG